jgi:hypothetical protein
VRTRTGKQLITSYGPAYFMFCLIIRKFLLLEDVEAGEQQFSSQEGLR